MGQIADRGLACQMRGRKGCCRRRATRRTSFSVVSSTTSAAVASPAFGWTRVVDDVVVQAVSLRDRRLRRLHRLRSGLVSGGLACRRRRGFCGFASRPTPSAGVRNPRGGGFRHLPAPLVARESHPHDSEVRRVDVAALTVLVRRLSFGVAKQGVCWWPPGARRRREPRPARSVHGCVRGGSSSSSLSAGRVRPRPARSSTDVVSGLRFRGRELMRGPGARARGRSGGASSARRHEHAHTRGAPSHARSTTPRARHDITGTARSGAGSAPRKTTASGCTNDDVVTRAVCLRTARNHRGCLGKNRAGDSRAAAGRGP